MTSSPPRSRPAAPARVAVAVLAAGALSACAQLFEPPPQVVYYTLQPAAVPSAAPTSFGAGPIVALQTVRLPQYLDQNGVVVRNGAEVSVAATRQWASPLSDQTTSVIAQNLAVDLGSDRVVTFPINPALPVDRVVQITISRFEADELGRVELAAQWLVFGERGRSFVDARAGRWTVDGARDYDAIARAMSAALTALSADIAASLALSPAAQPPRPAAAAAL